VISDKPSGLVVDYIGIGCELKQALKVGTSIKSIENLSKNTLNRPKSMVGF